MALMLFGLVTFIVTAVASVGNHSTMHNVIARAAMFLEAGLVVVALMGHDGRILAVMIAVCFVAVALTDTDRGNMAIRQWLKGDANGNSCRNQ